VEKSILKGPFAVLALACVVLGSLVVLMTLAGQPPSVS
jgi:hypothetical protein